MKAETRIAFLVLSLAAIGCSTEAENTPAAPPAIRVGTENVVMVSKGMIVVGPIISGELRAEREATVRAEIGGSVTQVTVKEGQAVRRGALLGRIETRTLDDVKQSAMSAVRNAENQLAVAQREMERTETLVKPFRPDPTFRSRSYTASLNNVAEIRRPGA